MPVGPHFSAHIKQGYPIPCVPGTDCQLLLESKGLGFVEKTAMIIGKSVAGWKENRPPKATSIIMKRHMRQVHREKERVREISLMISRRYIVNLICSPPCYGFDQMLSLHVGCLVCY
jgi:hypothetical protein